MIYRRSPSFPCFRVGSDGSVIGMRGKIIKGYKGKGKYRRVSIRINGKQSYVDVHVLVCEAFHGLRPIGMEASHRDGNHDNNAAENLRWATCLENHADMIAHGVQARGERQGSAKLTDQAVRHIRDEYRKGSTLDKLANHYSVAVCTIHDVVTGKTWRHVK